MIKKIDRYIFIRLLVVTLFVLGVLIFIFIVIDFSENSDDFTDRGAELPEIFGVYYLNYIPEMIRLVAPVAVFVACIFLTGQMTERLEITALKAAGVSLYRLILPFIAFGLVTAAVISYLDGFVIPHSNATRIDFEQQYLREKSEDVDGNKIYRQESPNNLYRFNHFDDNSNTAYRVEVVRFDSDSVRKTIDIQRMKWQEESQRWLMLDVTERTFDQKGFQQIKRDTVDTLLNILPRDLARTTSDIYQLTYQEAANYIASIERSGAGSVGLPKVQYYGRLSYPVSILIVTIIGFAIACSRRKGGRGFYIAAGLSISFLYLAFMKVIEPFGSSGTLDPLTATILPHLFFFIVGIALFLTARK